MESQTLDFRCGCFLKFWVDGELQAALSCCPEHEAPEQTLSKILSMNNELVIDRKYVPSPPRPTLEDEVRTAATKYPDITIHKGFANLFNEGHVIEFTLPLCDAWNKKSTRIGFLLPPGYPGNAPGGPGLIGFWSDADLRTSYGAWHNRTGLRYVERDADTSPKECLVHFGALQAWNPNHDTVLTYARTIDLALNRGKK